MDEFQSLHYSATYGELLCAEGELCNVADLVRLRTCLRRQPLHPAVRDVLTALETDAGIALYVTRPTDYARLVDEEIIWRPARGETPESRGRAGLLAAVRRAWLRDDITEAGLYERALIRRGQLAVLIDAANAAGLLDPLRDLEGSQTAARPAVVGGAGLPSAHSTFLSDFAAAAGWPREKGVPWTNAERDAMFELRHLHQCNDQQIAQLAGVSRQLIGQQIGSGDAYRRNDWTGGPGGWKPSPELLRRCRLPLHPLQSVSADLSATAAKSA